MTTPAQPVQPTNPPATPPAVPSVVPPVESQKFETPFQKVMTEAEKAPVVEPSEDEKKKADEEARVKKESEEKARVEAEKKKQEEEKQKGGNGPSQPAASDAEKQELETLRSRVKEYETDPIAAVRKHHPQVFENLEAAADIDGFIAKWQQTDLIKELKEKFPEKVGEGWVYDAAEAYTAGTPSYRYRIATDEKRQAVVKSLESKKVQEETVVRRYSEQRDADIKFLKETFTLTDEAFAEKMKAFDGIHEQVLSGKQPAEKHPLSLRNLYRGFFFDELVAAQVQKAKADAIAELKSMYAQKGITLPEITPTNVTAQPQESNPTKPITPKKPLSPFERQMEKMASE